MAVSNTNNFNLVTSQIIQLAYSRIGLYTEFHDLTNFQYQQGLTLLNTMTKSLKVFGDNLWKTARGTLFLASGQNNYILDGSTANATENFTATTLNVDAASGASTISVTSTTGFADTYFVGITLNNNNIFWTTENGAPVGNIITLASTLTGAASSGNAVYVYQTKISRPESITSLQTQLNINTQIDCVKLSRNSYDRIPNKNSPIQSFPSQFYYSKELTYGQIFLWPTPNTSVPYVQFTFQKQFFDFTNPTDSPDLPPEWLNALYRNLAVFLAGHNGIRDPQIVNDLKQEAAQALMDAKGYDNEETSIYFQPASVINTNTYR